MHLERDLVVPARVGAALIRVMQQAGLGAAALDRHRQGLQGEMPVIHRTDRPADDEARKEIQDGRQREIATAAGHKLRRIADPSLIGSVRRELAGEQIGGDRLVTIAYRLLEAYACSCMRAVW